MVEEGLISEADFRDFVLTYPASLHMGINPDYPSETFRVLKEREIKEYSEYRTARLAPQAWHQRERGL